MGLAGTGAAALAALWTAALVGLGPAHAGEPRQGRIRTVVHEPADMVVVPAGTFTMGPSEDELRDLLLTCHEELDQGDYVCVEDWYGNFKLEEREVFLDAFAIDRHEVTVAEFRACVAAGACDLAALVAGDERYLGADLPMVNATWQDAVDYCAWAGKRLPSEAEWEKAARGTRGGRWPWGNHDRRDGANHGRGESNAMLYTHRLVPRTAHAFYASEFAPDDRDGYRYLAPPGALRWSEGPYGTFDMAGNAAEWVRDYFSFEGYKDLPTSNPVRDRAEGRGAGLRVIRGGSWAEPRFFGRTYHRHAGLAKERSPWVGFRCARSLE